MNNGAHSLSPSASCRGRAVGHPFLPPSPSEFCRAVPVPPSHPHPIPDPILNLARLTAAHEIAPLPHPGRPSLGARWGRMLRGGMARICLRQLRLRRAKAATRNPLAEDSASEGLRLLRRTLAGFRPSELAFILPEDSVRAVWELSDGDDGLIWADTIQRQLEQTCGPFTDEELEAWCNLDATIGDLAALLDKILSENRPIPPPRPSLFARLFAKKTNSSPPASCRGRAVGHPIASALPPRAFAFFASPSLRSLRCSLRIPGRAARPPKTFPTIGNIFSIHWKTPEKFFQSLEKSARIFQPLEKNFPIIGKIHENFPTIGKKLSNHWKTFPAALLPSYFFLLTSRP